jgi:hypothetical protein
LLADSPCADTDAPLETIELAAACFRFARDGDVGAGGSVGGVRTPLAAMVMVKGAVSRCANDAVRKERAQLMLVCVVHRQCFPARRGRMSSRNSEQAVPSLQVPGGDAQSRGRRVLGCGRVNVEVGGAFGERSAMDGCNARRQDKRPQSQSPVAVPNRSRTSCR